MTSPQIDNYMAMLRNESGERCRQLLLKYESAERLSTPFADSTHQIWFLQKDEARVVLKLADLVAVQNQVFWRGVEQLFAWNLAENYPHLTDIYPFLSRHSGMKIPCLKDSCEEEKAQIAWLITEYVPGQVVEVASVTQYDCQQLAKHLIAMHLSVMDGVGVAAASKPLTFSEFKTRLIQFLQTAPRLQEMSKKQGLLLLRCAQNLMSEKLVPMVLDLRWDQFLRSGQEELVLVDVDATLSAPVEMDWLMLEVVLEKDHLQQVIYLYKQQLNLPSRENIQALRLLYRAVFCGIGLLGEQDWLWWQQLPPNLDELLG